MEEFKESLNLKLQGHSSKSRDLFQHFQIQRPQLFWKKHQTHYFIKSTSDVISNNKQW